jgi:hypothetical protein
MQVEAFTFVGDVAGFQASPRCQRIAQEVSRYSFMPGTRGYVKEHVNGPVGHYFEITLMFKVPDSTAAPVTDLFGNEQYPQVDVVQSYMLMSHIIGDARIPLSDLVKMAVQRITNTFIRHEHDEWLRVDGKRLVDPHANDRMPMSR